ncbi:hypothetical protein MCOR25_002879 [Pyricularia grisea]|uniref:Uncharacterized protein n=1 Tax=Pyricularia grisea TaxID=148305 RepID=A0A6P8BFN6_PYRGI|nr:uncharacterized protein PgNI_01188 [Pyricularia grisea]KAI6376064.1 hypothetical protein MCOR25_002879 [Pyricularia grisea]TLD15608.1 hypothetical protein PgNI_01188 [Pyricularia grisea]
MTEDLKRHNLGQFIPREGFIYRVSKGGRVCARRNYDYKITLTLMTHAVLKKEVVEALLARIFIGAAYIAREHKNDFFDIVDAAQRHCPWTKDLPQPVMIDLVRELFDSRARWHQHNQVPFDIAEHGELAKAIDALAKIVGPAWTTGVEELYDLAGGYLDYDADKDMVLGNTLDTRPLIKTAQSAYTEEQGTTHACACFGQFLMPAKITDKVPAKEAGDDGDVEMGGV